MKKGFTLVEIMIVVSVIAILAGIGMVSFSNARKTAIRSTCKVNMRQLEESLVRYSADNGSFPAALNGLAPDYIKKVPNCPAQSADNSYNYDSVSGVVTCRTTADHTL